jgi:hypothetical protein
MVALDTFRILGERTGAMGILKDVASIVAYNFNPNHHLHHQNHYHHYHYHRHHSYYHHYHHHQVSEQERGAQLESIFKG